MAGTEARVAAEAAFRVLRKRGIAYAEAAFHGAGDSGEVDGVEAWRDGVRKGKPEWLTLPELHDAVHVLAGEADWDWYNNEGGGGTVAFFVADGRVEVAGYWNETTEHAADGYTMEGFAPTEEFAPTEDDPILRAEARRLIAEGKVPLEEVRRIVGTAEADE